MRNANRKTGPILRYIAKLETCTVFVTADLLPLAPRSVIDQLMQRMVANGWVKRLARGVYAKWYGAGRQREFSMFEIAMAKARAFGKWCPCESCNTITDGTEIVLDDGARQLTLKVHGRTTSTFMVGTNRIVLQGTGKRRRTSNEEV